MQDRVVIRRGRADDAAAVADLHAGQIREGFLSLLGPGFLRSLYRRITLVEGSFLLVAQKDTATVGFLAGSMDVGALYRSFLWRDGVATAIRFGWPLLRSWRRVLETLRHGSGDTGSGAELLAVAVEPAARGHGAGGLLVNGFLEEIGRRHQHSAYVVVGAANDTAIALYERAGFLPLRQFQLHSGTESLVMQWSLPAQERRDP
jgi:ribosomal protein S18 acetylase RimI-like enzyme